MVNRGVIAWLLPKRQALKSVLYILNVAVIVLPIAAAALIEARGRVVVSAENGYLCRGQIVDADAGSIQRGRIGVAGREIAAVPLPRSGPFGFGKALSSGCTAAGALWIVANVGTYVFAT